MIRPGLENPIHINFCTDDLLYHTCTMPNFLCACVDGYKYNRSCFLGRPKFSFGKTTEHKNIKTHLRIFCCAEQSHDLEYCLVEDICLLTSANYKVRKPAQETFTCSKLTKETLKKKMWNILEVNNKDTKTTSVWLF